MQARGAQLVQVATPGADGHLDPVKIMESDPAIAAARSAFRAVTSAVVAACEVVITGEAGGATLAPTDDEIPGLAAVYRLVLPYVAETLERCVGGALHAACVPRRPKSHAAGYPPPPSPRAQIAVT